MPAQPARSPIESSRPSCGLTPITLKDLGRLPEGMSWEVDAHLEGLTSLTPVRGQLRVTLRRTMLEVAGDAATIITLCCDRCLQHFNHPLRFETSELIWIDDDARPEELDSELVGAAITNPELDPEDCSEKLDPNSAFDPAHWLFEQLSLQLPLVSRCGDECPGPATWSTAGPVGDPRFGVLAALQQQPEPGSRLDLPKTDAP